MAVGLFFVLGAADALARDPGWWLVGVPLLGFGLWLVWLGWGHGRVVLGGDSLRIGRWGRRLAVPREMVVGFELGEARHRVFRYRQDVVSASFVEGWYPRRRRWAAAGARLGVSVDVLNEEIDRERDRSSGRVVPGRWVVKEAFPAEGVVVGLFVGVDLFVFLPGLQQSAPLAIFSLVMLVILGIWVWRCVQLGRLVLDEQQLTVTRWGRQLRVPRQSVAGFELREVAHGMAGNRRDMAWVRLDDGSEKKLSSIHTAPGSDKIAMMIDSLNAALRRDRVASDQPNS